MNLDGLFASITNIPIIGVAIGLMLTYLVVSLVASSVKEAVAGVFQWRGTYLQHGIGALLSIGTDSHFSFGNVSGGVLCRVAGFIWNWLKAHVSRVDPTGPADQAIILAEAAITRAKEAVAQAKAVIGPGAIAAPVLAVLNAARTAATTAANALSDNAGKDKISNVADVFTNIRQAANAAVAAATPAAVTEAEQRIASAQAALAVFKVRVHPLIKGTPTSLPSYVPSRDFATAVLDLLRDGAGGAAFAQIKRTVDALPPGDIKRTLSAFVAEAGNDIDKLRARIEAWFDDAMDRLGGIYKRFAQYFLLALGLAIAVLLNVDSVHLAIALWDQPALRTQIVAKAIADIPATKQPEQPTTPADKTHQDMQAALGRVQAAADQVKALPLPIGRVACSNSFGQLPTNLVTPGVCPAKPVYKHWGSWAAWTIGGWIVTAFAISLGAPFWFGLLQNIMNLRAAGNPPPRSDARS